MFARVIEKIKVSRFFMDHSVHTYIHTHPFHGPLDFVRDFSDEFYWSKRQWVAVASGGSYPNLHLILDR